MDMNMDMPALPLPQPASIDEKLSEFDSVPLFMRSLPEDASDNVTISALQSLAYEGTPDEIAENFKDQGNNYFKAKRFTEARNFYSQGLDAKATDLVLLDALLCNRAACNLELKNYGFVLRDCSKAISLNSRSAKAHYRSALALVALERFDEALDCCARCLNFDPENLGVQRVRERARKGKGVQETKSKERTERLRKEVETKRQLELGFKARNIIPIFSPHATENPYPPHFDTETQASIPTLVVPVFFLYPQHAQSDLISHYHEDTPFSDHITDIFPSSSLDSPEHRPDWDKEGEYVASNLVVYAITQKKRLLKVGKKMTLLDVCKAAKGRGGDIDGLELKDGCLSVVVLPKGEVESRWVEDFKVAKNQ